MGHPVGECRRPVMPLDDESLVELSRALAPLRR